MINSTRVSTVQFTLLDTDPNRSEIFHHHMREEYRIRNVQWWWSVQILSAGQDRNIEVSMVNGVTMENLWYVSCWHVHGSLW